MGGKIILVLAPHTDDGELGCGGTIAKLVDQGDTVYYAAFSMAEQSVPDGMKKDILKDEVREATRILGIKPENLKIYRYRVREFPTHRQSILEELVSLKKTLQPDAVFLPSQSDIHQDHGVISIEGLRAFKDCTVLGYELPWNNCSFNTQAFVKLEEEHICRKLEALRCYRSQGSRAYMDEGFVRGLALTRGTQMGCRLAEAFEVIRWII